MPAARPSAPVAFAALGHFYVHLFTAIYFVIVLSLERVWQRPYHELIELWTVGSLLVGAAALPAGMLGDRFGATRMMVVYFLGLGASSIAAGLVSTPLALLVMLAALGAFASIYHPVGIPWLVRNAEGRTGRALGINGVFGSFGTAGAAAVAGLLIDLVSWRAAFIVPGVVCAVTGVAMAAAVRRGTVGDRLIEAARDHERQGRRETVRAFTILVVTMFIAGLVYHAIQTALPKTFALRFGVMDGSTTGVGLLVALVYFGAGLMQIIGGVLADRYPLKPVYVGTILAQVPAIWLVGALTGIPLVFLATLTVMAGAAALPAENMLLSRYTPPGRHGLAFGLKFVLAFGAAPVAVQLVARVSEATGGVLGVFPVLTALAGIAFLAAATLPRVGPRTVG